MTPFTPFPKIPRLTRDMIVSEKIDGTNGCISIGESGEILVGSRNRWITPNEDNFGFARWAYENKDELIKLGPGRHFGEWYGAGIQRGYGLKEKRFALFNVNRWSWDAEAQTTEEWGTHTHGIIDRKSDIRVGCCGIVPVLYKGPFDLQKVDDCLYGLARIGSAAVPGFMKPEGVVIYHVAGGYLFKKTIEGDESPKSVTPNNPALQYGACGKSIEITGPIC